MKIISKFKDYYDYVPHLAGGGDPLVIYNRNKFDQPWDTFEVTHKLTLDLGYLEEHSYLCVNGRVYLLKPKKYDSPYTIEFNPPSFRSWHTSKYHLGEINKSFFDLAIKIRAPVFMVKLIHRNGTVTISSLVPVLKDIVGFPALYPPEQLYQDIAYFMGSIREPPPMSKLPDIDKVLQHGFDLKKSFRHRT